MKDNKKKTVKAVKECLETIESLKECLNHYYETLDDLIPEVKKIKLKKSDGIELVDNFKNTNVQFRTTSVKRYEIRRTK